MKLKLLLFQFFLMVGVLANAQNDTIKTLIFSEAHLGNIQRNYVEITNMGTETVDLSMFELGATRTNDYLGRDWMFPAGTTLAPGESYFIGVYHDFVASRAKFMTPETYTEDPPTEFEQAEDYQVHVEDYDFANNPTGILGNVSVWIPFDSIGTNDPPIRTYFMRDCIYLEQHFPSGDSAVVDQVGGTFGLDADEDGILENFYPGTDQGSLPVAGYQNAGSFANLVRKFSVKQGNTEFIVGNSEDDSEWLTIENLTYNNYRKQPWTFGNHGDYNLDANTLEPMAGSGITVDFPGKIIHVPWGTYRPDGIMAQMEYKPGVAWFPAYYTAEDSTSWQFKTGDSLLIVVLGNDADRATFRIEVDEPAASENRVTPTLNEQINYNAPGVLYTPTAAELEGYLYYLSKSVKAYGFAQVTDGAPTMDTISGLGSSIVNLGIPSGTRIDTLLERLEKAPKASWEIVPVDGNAARPDLMNGDILKVTAEDGSEKEYFIKMAVDVGNNNASLSAITWPDIPDPELFKYLYGWQGDTIPNFGPNATLYQLKLPPEVTSIPATVAKPSNVSANVSVQRATYLQGTQEERTTTYTVTATDDTTTIAYSVEWQPEPDPEYLQPYSADPFFSQYIERWYFSDHFLEIANPGNQILDLSNYMIVHDNQPNPAIAIQSAGNVDDYGFRFRKYIPGYVWTDESDWAAEEKRFFAIPDPAINPLVKAGDVFCLADNARVSGWGYGTTGWTPEDFPGSPSSESSVYGQVDVNFQLDWGNPWGIAVSRYQTCIALAANGQYQYLFKILNDSIKQGLKAATDPNDFELIDVMGNVEGGRWNYGFPKIPTYVAGSKVERKPEIIHGNPVMEASFGSGDPVATGELDETTEWIYTDGASPNRASGPWPNNRIATGFLGFGSHYFIPYTGYVSTVSARIYKVSPGYSMDEQIRGLKTGTTVSTFLEGLTKKDEGQTLMAKSAADGSELGMDDLIVNGDTLVVMSADETNITKYVLEVTEDGLRSDALLTSTRYVVEVTTQPTKSTGAAEEAGVGTVTGFEYGTQLKTIIANVTAPDGATMSVIDAAGNYVPTKQLNFDTVYVDVTVNSDTYFEVVAEDGVTTIVYQLKPQASADAAFITSDYFNVVQSQKLVEFVPGGISVSSLMAKLVPSAGATMMLVDKSGLERTMGSIARDDEIVVTSASGNVTTSYFIQVITSADPLGPGLGYYLAYVTSNFYPVDQVMNKITVDNSAGAVSVSEFMGRLVPHTDGATLEVMDENTNGMMNSGDMVKVTARDGRFSAMYAIDFTVSSRMVKNNINLYPNPTSGRVNISGLEVGGRVQVYNYTGSAIRDFKVRSNVESLSLDDQPAGMYLIRISDSNSNQVGRYKLMKR